MRKVIIDKMACLGILTLVCATGCSSASANDIGSYGENTDTDYSAAQDLSKSFLEYWENPPEDVLPIDSGMVMSTVDVFSFTNSEDFDKIAFLVYPEYKTCRALIYGIKDNAVNPLGNISCGFGFALSSENGILRTTSEISGSHSSETFNTYYSVSVDGLAKTLELSIISDGNMATGYRLYDENGTSSELTHKEYFALKDEADAVFGDAQFISLDTDNNFVLDRSFDISGDGDFTDYIYRRISD